MKIAVLFYGQLRWLPFANKSLIENFLPALQGHDVHFFANFWGNPPEKLEEYKKIIQFKEISFQDQLTIDNIKAYFNNKINKISDNLPSQLYSLHQSFLLLDYYKDEKYDLFIKIRTDLAFLNKFKIEDYDNSIYVCKNKYNQNLNKYATDLLAITNNYDNFKKLCTMGFALDEILDSFREDKSLFYHEEILAKHLVRNNISIKSHNLEIDLARNYE
jgi:hypothetical protein